MTYSFQSEHAKYAQQLAEYTRRQFRDAQCTLQSDEFAMRKLPVSYKHVVPKLTRCQQVKLANEVAFAQHDARHVAFLTSRTPSAAMFPLPDSRVTTLILMPPTLLGLLVLPLFIPARLFSASISIIY
ncbi:hypothetical protein FISHEDRAFT_74043 [Fistulina hepatica ATCC 64428]|uniref:Uncharacterized protein n=1 Tax=Fistulina hepatica ATCC 64428 TaxID=1128425 RepID=A0A0D7AAK9_9AGAR|nr:hypothetical protein FISHEDRAFT_74043 [Fistulina hepatica ATCC 64428]